MDKNPDDRNIDDNPVDGDNRENVTTNIDETDNRIRRNSSETRLSGHANHGKKQRNFSNFYVFTRRPEDVDAEQDVEFTVLSLVWTMISILLYIGDIISDLVVSSLLHSHGYNWWFALSLSATLIPGFVVNAFSLQWYLDDEKKNVYKTPPITRTDLIIRFGSHFVGLGPVIRYVDLMMYGWKSRQQLRSRKHKRIQEPIGNEEPTNKDGSLQKCEDGKTAADDDEYDYIRLMICADRDSTMLSLLEAFMEAAPQLILQIYILIKRGHPVTGKPSVTTDVWQCISIISSLVSMAWGLASYHRALRLSVKGKAKMTRTGTILQFLWRLGTISSRMFSLALFASHFHYWLAPVLIGHWGLVTIWILHQDTKFCRSNEEEEPNYCAEYVYDMVMGVVSIFCFFNVKEGKTLHKYIAYYVITFLENCIGVSLWYSYSDYNVWYHKPAMALVFLSFIFGIMFMLIYYSFYHPKGKMFNILFRECVDATENQTLFASCCSNNQTSHSIAEENASAPLANRKGSMIFTIESEDGNVNKIPDTKM